MWICLLEGTKKEENIKLENPNNQSSNPWNSVLAACSGKALIKSSDFKSVVKAVQIV